MIPGQAGDRRFIDPGNRRAGRTLAEPGCSVSASGQAQQGQPFGQLAAFGVP